MPPPRRHLLLPSEKGLVHYDLLEETAFLGKGARGAILASPTPFPEASIVLSDDGRGFVVRAMPGEPPPEVNGEAGDGVRLADGARIRVAGQVALFRSPTQAGAEAVVAAPSRAERAAVSAARTEVTRNAGVAAKVLALTGALLLLFAVYQAIRYLDTKGAEPTPPIVASMFDEAPVVRSTPEEAAHEEFARLAAFDTGDVTKLQELFDGYAAVARSGRGTAAGARAAMRLREIRPQLAAKVWKDTSIEIEGSARSGRYRSALAMLDAFDARFAGTDAALAVPDRVADVRRQAREALGALTDRALPLMARDARAAYRFLTASSLELPPDLSEELAALMAKVRDAAGGPAPKPPAPAPTLPGPTPLPPRPPTPAPTGGKPKDGGPFANRPKHPGAKDPDAAPPPPAVDVEASAKALWIAAREHLAARRFQEARDAYSRVLREFGTAAVVRAHPERLTAGRKAADVGLRGPIAFLREEATFKNGRLECEWSFDDETTFLEDFSVEQAFIGVEPAECAIRSGVAILSGSTAILVNVVFDSSSVIWEADCVADAHRDYGLYGRQETKEIRTLLLDVGNTQLNLKKGAAAKVLAGHVLWLFGDGVWRDADKGAQGYIRLAEQPGNNLKPGERLRLELEVLGDRVEGSIHSKNDPAALKGPLKGDDGKGMSSMRIGAFTQKGLVAIERLKVSGKIDESWALLEFQRLSKADTGPD